MENEKFRAYSCGISLNIVLSVSLDGTSRLFFFILGDRRKWHTQRTAFRILQMVRAAFLGLKIRGSMSIQVRILGHPLWRRCSSVERGSATPLIVGSTPTFAFRRNKKWEYLLLLLFSAHFFWFLNLLLTSTNKRKDCLSWRKES